MEPLTKEDLTEWADHPVTRRVIAALEATVKHRRETIMHGLWETGEADKWFLSKAVAYSHVIDALKMADVEEINEWSGSAEASPEDG